MYTKFGLNRSISFQDIEQKLILTSIKGRNSVANLPKFELIQAFMHVLDTCKNEEDPIKNEGARLFTRFSHYKSMGIFPDAQGQLTPQSLVLSGRISNSSEILWMSLLPASMKKIRSKMKALEWTQHFPHYNSMVAMETSGRIWPNFELIQALIHVLITCKYEKNPIKNSGENVMTSFSPL